MGQEWDVEAWNILGKGPGVGLDEGAVVEGRVHILRARGALKDRGAFGVLSSSSCLAGGWDTPHVSGIWAGSLPMSPAPLAVPGLTWSSSTS